MVAARSHRQLDQGPVLLASVSIEVVAQTQQQAIPSPQRKHLWNTWLRRQGGNFTTAHMIPLSKATFLRLEDIVNLPGT